MGRRHEAFAINYGSVGIGTEIWANRIEVGPGGRTRRRQVRGVLPQLLGRRRSGHDRRHPRQRSPAAAAPTRPERPRRRRVRAQARRSLSRLPALRSDRPLAGQLQTGPRRRPPSIPTTRPTSITATCAITSSSGSSTPGRGRRTSTTCTPTSGCTSPDEHREPVPRQPAHHPGHGLHPGDRSTAAATAT